MAQEIHTLLLPPFNTELASFCVILKVIKKVFYCGLEFLIYIEFYTCNSKTGYGVEMNYVFTSLHLDVLQS